MTEYCAHQMVVLDTLGYKDRLGYIDGRAVSAPDNTPRYRVFLRGTHTCLTFRADEMRPATPEEIKMTEAHPNAKHI